MLAGNGGMLLGDSEAVRDLTRSWPKMAGPYEFDVDGRKLELTHLNPEHVLGVAVSHA
jgi:hypothetical protein